MCLSIVIVFSFKIAKLTPTLICEYLNSGGDIDMVCNTDGTRKCGWSLSTNVEGSWRVCYEFGCGSSSTHLPYPLVSYSFLQGSSCSNALE